MKRSFLFILFGAIITVALSQNPTYRQKLYYSCKVWGFVKYYHSRVSTGQVNWDSVLMGSLPIIKNAGTTDEFNDALASMLTAAGPMAIASTPSPDTLPPELKRNLNFGWIDDPVLRNDVSGLLDTIKNNFRPHSIVWVRYFGSGSWLWFPYDDPMIESNAFTNYPDEFTRLLILFKYWNIINYFNPYNYVLDLPWDNALYDNVVAMAEAPDYLSYYKTIKKITANANDAHVEGLTWSTAYSFYGGYSPDLILRYTPNGYVVVISGYGDVSKGDILVSINNLSMDQLEDSLRPYISAGNSSVFRRFMCRYLLRGSYGSQVEMVYTDSLGDSHTKLMNRSYQIADNWYPNDTLKNEKFKKWECNVGY
ncbi:MAG: hypothetical protein ABIJ04_01045, partial [Bacteroidota bacterium]